MVTLIKYGALSGGVKYNANVMFIDGLAAEQKPTDKIEGMPIANGSVFTEIDTGKTYMFNAENKTWHEVDLGGGGGGGGGGFTPTAEQLAAMNSGITSTKVEQIETNKDEILSEQAKTTGMTKGGSDYITVNGIRLYVSSTAPTGNIPDGSVGVGW